MKKLRTENGNFLVYSIELSKALYIEHESSMESLYSRGKNETKINILKTVADGCREWNWALKTWGVEPQEVTVFEKNLLLRANAKVETLAVKNSKGWNPIFDSSIFFKTKDGEALVTRAIGKTYRRSHQGSNHWDLFNIERTQESQESQELSQGDLCFGTYYGEGFFVNGINSLIPISWKEWEELSGRKFFLKTEFQWFKGKISYPGLDRSYNLWDLQFITDMKCYQDAPIWGLMVTEKKDSFLYKGVICNKEGFKTFFTDKEEALRQVSLVGGKIFDKKYWNSDWGFIVLKTNKTMKKVRFLPSEEGGYFKTSKMDEGSIPTDGWYAVTGCSGSDGLESGYFNHTVAVWERLPVSTTDFVEVKNGEIVSYTTPVPFED